MNDRIAPIVFDVRIGRQRRLPYYRILIFPSKDAMYAYERMLYSTTTRRGFKKRGPVRVRGTFNFTAITHRYDGYRRRAGKWRRSLNLGQILFHDGGYGAGIVAHEMSHAALYSFNGWRRRSPNRLDEALAWRIGFMVSEFWREYYKRRPHDAPSPKKPA